MACTGNYYISAVDGTIQQQCNGVLADALKATGFQGPYPSIAAAKAAVTPATAGIAKQVDNAVPGLSQIGKAFNDLTEGPFWIRALEVLLGLGLIVVALAKLASGTSAGKAAVAAGKAAAIL